MGLPTSRDITVNPADPVPSTLLNTLQDCIIGMKRPSSWRWINPSTPNVLNVSGSNTMQEDNLLYGAAGEFAGMPLGNWLEGDRITGFAVRHLGTGTVWTPTYLLRMSSGDGATTTIGTLTFANPPAAWATYTLIFNVGVVLPAHTSLYLSQTGSANVSNRLGPIGIQSDRL